MEAATNPNKTNTFPNNLPLHIYKFILLFIAPLYFNTQFEKNRWFENTPPKPLKLRLFHAWKSKNQNSQTVRICIFCV